MTANWMCRITLFSTNTIPGRYKLHKSSQANIMPTCVRITCEKGNNCFVIQLFGFDAVVIVIIMVVSTTFAIVIVFIAKAFTFSRFKVLKLLQMCLCLTWWRHQMETFSALLAICAGNSPVPGEFPAQRPVTRSFDVFFDLRLNKRLRKQSWGWWFETQSCPLWRQCNDNVCSIHVRTYCLVRVRYVR